MTTETLDDQPTFPVSPRVLRSARERVGLDMDAAANRVQAALKAEADGSEFRPNLIGRLESGRDQPTMLELEALGTVYMLPFVDFFQPDLEPIRIRDFRLGPDGTRLGLTYETHQKLNEFDRLYGVTALAALETEPEAGVRLPRLRSDELSAADALEAAGEAIRRTLGAEAACGLGYDDC